nr:MAG TPA: ASCH domain protein [Caudoviricetes sp.]
MRTLIEKPILFSEKMVLALLNGQKRQTRRIVQPQPVQEGGFWHLGGAAWSDGIETLTPFPSHSLYNKAKYHPGDTLWVQETWQVHDLNDGACCMMIKYKADGATALQVEFSPSRYEKFRKYYGKNGWQSPYFFPKEATRIFLRVDSTRIERLHHSFFEPISPIFTVRDEGIDIGDTCRDCIENYGSPCCVDTVDEDGTDLYGGECGMLDEARSEFADLWDGLNSRRGYDWSSNPWTWAYGFERVYPETKVVMA